MGASVWIGFGESSHGQSHVAASSRVGKPTDLFVYGPKGNRKLIVYPRAPGRINFVSKNCNKKQQCEFKSRGSLNFILSEVG